MGHGPRAQGTGLPFWSQEKARCCRTIAAAQRKIERANDVVGAILLQAGVLVSRRDSRRWGWGRNGDRGRCRLLRCCADR